MRASILPVSSPTELTPTLRLAALAALIGTPGDDVLEGTAGGDTIFGGDGNDYINGLASIDGQSIDYLYGGTGEDTLFGIYCYGGEGNDHLSNMLDVQRNGGVLYGGAGDDSYYIAANEYVYWDYGVTILENADQGIDTVYSFGGTVILAATSNVENIVLLGVVNATAVGNNLDNVLTGNIGSNQLDGRGGADRMIGGRGNDSYVLDNLGDRAIERAGEGIDTIVAFFALKLGSACENLVLGGANDINGTGNDLANVLIGNVGSNLLRGGNGADTLNGGGGADSLNGGGGNDVYLQDNTYVLAGFNLWASVAEGATGGIDTVFAAPNAGRYTYILDANVENLVATGTDVFRLWGNELANAMTGNPVFNVLNGFGGHDTLTGGGSIDEFHFTALDAGSSDTITDFTHLTDQILVSAAAFGGGLFPGGSVILNASATPTINSFLGNLAQFLYDTDDGTLSFDADGDGAGAAVLFATLTNLPSLTAADILIIA